MYYYLIIALQAFCVYHVIKNKNEIYWIYIIIFIPMVGLIIYLITQVFSKRDLETVQDGLTSVINPTKKVKDLKRKLNFSETFQNKVDLADAYFEIYDYQNAINLYEDAINSNFSNDTYVISNLVDAYFYIKNYEKVITYFQLLEEQNDSKKPSNQLHYGLALTESGKPKTAERVLRKLDLNFSNYNERLIIAEFLIKRNKKEDAKEILNKIIEESNHFTKVNRRIYRQTITNVKLLLKTI